MILFIILSFNLKYLNLHIFFKENFNFMEFLKIFDNFKEVKPTEIEQIQNLQIELVFKFLFF